MLFQKAKANEIQIDRCGTKMKFVKREMKHEMKCKMKCERILSYRRRFGTQPPKCGRTPCGKVSFCTSLKRLWGKTMVRASLAVETAFVLPLFFMGMVTLISFMDIYKQQTEHLTKLCASAKQMGMYAYEAEGGGPEEITLPDVYLYKPIGGFIPLPSIPMHNTVKVHAWTGRDAEAFSDTGEEAPREKMVYVTESGTVYHKDLRCSYIDLSVNRVSGKSVAGMRNQYGEKYTACEICSRNQPAGGSVYVTGQGNRYHNLASCSGLKRSVRMVKESDIGEMHACSRCG